jgi:hypothetical protein
MALIRASGLRATSTTAQNDGEAAHRWLHQAIALSRDPALTEVANSILTTVAERQQK